MDSLYYRMKGTEQRPGVRKAIREAKRWSEPNEHIGRYSTETGDYLLHYPRSLEDDTEMRNRMNEIYKQQAFLACKNLEILISMNFMQQARLEADCASDNWARDAKGINEAHIQSLITAHKALRSAYDSYHY